MNKKVKKIDFSSIPELTDAQLKAMRRVGPPILKEKKLTKEEQKISDDIAKGKYRSLPKERIQEYSRMAEADIERRKALRKEERINVRLTREDLANLKDRAEEEGIPYQTLVTSILHRYLFGRLVDIHNVTLLKKTRKR